MSSQDNTEGVKIIIAGLPRTSTTSLKKGLELLGVGPCFHLGDPPAPIARVKESARVLAIKDRHERLKALKKLYDGFEAVFEPPASTLVDDMLTIYPNAKVILSIRQNPEVWLASYHGLGIDLRSPVYRILGYWIPGVIHSSDLIVAWSRYYSQKFGLDVVPSVELYLKHNQWVRDIVPAGQLLEYQPTNTIAIDPLLERSLASAFFENLLPAPLFRTYDLFLACLRKYIPQDHHSPAQESLADQTMPVSAAIGFAIAAQTSTALAIGYTARRTPVRFLVAAAVFGLIWLFNNSIQDGFESRLHVALLSTAMWIQSLKSLDDLCLTGISFRPGTVTPGVSLGCDNKPLSDGLIELEEPSRPQDLQKSTSQCANKLLFGFGMLWNMRGVGTMAQISQIPPWSRQDRFFVPLRIQELKRHIKNALLCYFVLDVFANQHPPDIELFMSPKKEKFFSRLTEIGAEEAIFRVFTVLGFWLNTFCVIQFINSVLCLVAYGISGAKRGIKLSADRS
ncbi:hypothetical protein HJFPF1_05751 [Paramyrothecium foliicola]|nr:hypothetical protein HJFPF1_05751 [Paramyrothecium foliicola]